MEREVTIYYRDEYSHKAIFNSTIITITDKQTTKDIIGKVVKKLDLTKYSRTNQTKGYKLINTRTAEIIDNNSVLFSMLENEFFIIPDEKSVSSESKNALIGLTLIVMPIVYVILIWTGRFGMIGWGIAAGILFLMLYVIPSVVSNREKKKMSAQNVQTIDSFMMWRNTSCNRVANVSKLTVNNEKSARQQIKDPNTNNYQQSNIKEKENTMLESNGEFKKTNEFYFDNVFEFIAYKRENDARDIVWLKGDKYEIAYNNIIKAFEREKYGEVIYLGRKCFDINPVAINVRFKMAEAYMAFEKLDDAGCTLIEMSKYITNKSDIADFYRKLGYIACEKKNWEFATACYRYSMIFESESDAVMALNNIQHQGYSTEINLSKIEEILTKSGIPIIKSDRIITLDDIDNTSKEETNVSKNCVN